jgi:predicted nucleotidyltransferase
VLAGADFVFELPTVFATSTAEIFAKGAVKLLKELPGEKHLCFGSESGDRESFLFAGKTLSEESKEFKKLLKSQLNEGVSLAKAKMTALSQMNTGLDIDLLKSPNNILGVEYTRAIYELKADIEIVPIKRLGAGFKDEEMHKDLSSASAIRKAVLDGKRRQIKSNVPKYVYEDLPATIPNADQLTYYSLIMNDKKQLKEILDCTEGLENRIKACLKSSTDLSSLKEKLLTKRYTATRINRILTHSLLGISENFIRKCLKSPLYLNVLAVKDGSEKMLADLRKNCDIPLITRKNDVSSLEGIAKDCFNKDVLANDVFGFLAGKHTNEYMMLKI